MKLVAKKLVSKKTVREANMLIMSRAGSSGSSSGYTIVAPRGGIAEAGRTAMRARAKAKS